MTSCPANAEHPVIAAFDPKTGDYWIIRGVYHRAGHFGPDPLADDDIQLIAFAADQPDMTAQAFAREFMKPVRCK